MTNAEVEACIEVQGLEYSAEAVKDMANQLRRHAEALYKADATDEAQVFRIAANALGDVIRCVEKINAAAGALPHG